MTGFSVGLGFDGLTSAILGQVHPIGVFIVAILFSGLKLGAQIGLQLKLDIPRELGGTIIGFIILFVAAGKLYEESIVRVRDWFTRRRGSKLKGESQLTWKDFSAFLLSNYSIAESVWRRPSCWPRWVEPSATRPEYSTWHWKARCCSELSWAFWQRYYLGNSYGGLLVAMIAGGLLGLLFAFLYHKYRVDLVILAIAFNLIIVELTVFVMRAMFGNVGSWSDPSIVRIPDIQIPLD